MSTSNNLYNFVIDKSSVYKVCNKGLLHIHDLKNIIHNCLVKVCYEEQKGNLSYEEFYLENASLFVNDVDKKYDEIMSLFQMDIGKLYVSNRVRLINKYNEKYDDVIIYCKDKFYQYFYEEIYNKLNCIDY